MCNAYTYKEQVTKTYLEFQLDQWFQLHIL